MRLIIHDLEEEELKRLFPKLEESVRVIRALQDTLNCIGCFGCWVKTPSVCVIRDEFQQIGALFAESSEVLLISKCCYGGYSPTVKRIMDRCISYLMPYFEIRKNEVHHVSRYSEKLRFTVRLYGEDITSEERAVAEQLVEANGLNLNASETSVRFYQRPEEMRGEPL